MSSSPIKRNISIRSSEILLRQFQDTASVFQSASKRFFLSRPVVDTHLENLSNPALKALVVAGVFKEHQCPVMVVCSDPHECMRYYRDLLQLLPADQIRRYPVEDFSPYDLANLPAQTMKQQYLIGKELLAGTPKIYLMAVKSLVLKHISPESQEKNALRITVDQAISPQTLAEWCIERGYLKTSIVLEPGEFSTRGDIFDLFPINAEPVRIEFFGDTVESIRRINAETQRSIDAVKEVFAIPRNALLLSPDNKSKLTGMLQSHLANQIKHLESVDGEALQVTIENQIQAMEQAFIPDGLDYYAPLLEADFKPLVELIPEKGILVYDDWVITENHLLGYTDRLSRQLTEGVAKGRLLDLGFQYHLTAEECFLKLQQRLPKRLYLDSFPAADPSKEEAFRFSMELTAPPAFKADLKEAVQSFQAFRQQGYQIYVTTDNPQRVLDNCKEWDVSAIYVAEDGLSDKDMDSLNLDVLVSKQGLLEGFCLEAEKIIHFTDAELFGRRRKKLIVSETSGTRRQDIETIKAIDELREGDYVVHQYHGIGRFVKLAQITIDKEKREYLTIQYSGNDRLHVPVDQVNLLARYRGSGDTPPKLNRMGGIDWSKTKQKVQKSIRSIARELTELYAVRARARGFQFEPDSPWQVELEEAFPYTETPDQWQAILDMKNDMESDKPMDRLICGDVGYGKTEVALRGIFKSVLSGKQVGVLVPTTILAQQHFNTLTDRFKPYPVRVGLLSRFRSPKEQKEVLDRLILGECDVVVGTHRLLQRDVHFKDLGLVIIDEEQRFGVSHKEKLKQIRKEVDVLTMSATPIPRTLYMSLSGIRDMSLINTPPVNRSPIKTFVGPYNPAQVRMAILQEVDRGGQVFFLHNRVQTIYAKLNELQILIPEVRFAVGHGQMHENDLETVMLDFAQKKHDVLLCTTIIESGLDLPNANTIIVDRADRFGLAQLYQIRGRVGRSETQAYAFCYYNQDQILTQDATERLRAIREFTTLGSGYQIALRDLEIRGVGNVLGSEQHGHMVAVGFDLYCQMLEESISELQGKMAETRTDAIIDLNVTAFMPDAWVGDKNVKLTEYKRLADIRSTRALDIIQAEWKDRFGDIPAETLQLVRLVKLRLMATALKIPTVREDQEFLRIAVPYSLKEWLQYQTKMPPEIGNKARWVPAVTSKEGSLPVLLVKQLTMKGSDQMAYVEKLFEQLKTLTESK
jgi:transcription-repair coupling factor (superfamily II helicase)